MAKINVVSISPDGKTEYPDTIDDSEVDAMKAKAESKGFTFQISEPLSEQEQTAVFEDNQKSLGLKETFLGGITQGLTLGTADAFGEDTENLRLLQEEKNPFTYGTGKFIGSLVPSGALVAGGAALGGAIGGPPGVVGGGAAGAALSGLIESYASKPTPPEGKGIPSGGDAAMGLISGATQNVAAKAAPIVRGAYRGVRNKLVGSVLAGEAEIAEGVAAEAARNLNKLNAALQKIESNVKFKKGEKLMNMSIDDIYDNLEPDDAADFIKIKETLVAAVKGLGGTDNMPMSMIKDVLTKQYKDATERAAKSATSSLVGGAGAALPMVYPDADLTQSEIDKLEKAALEQAFYNMQRSKLGSAKQ